ncbi:MAG TPA: hypothetical protein DD001_07820 [Microcoleaceae bacterium UBA10368]|jgi:hypothetical protein|nr:hypothetical protein [Microcoleaceae cyanobacterium UBA10368]HCV30143.1 hypothetical protein [Microcoleaceae cyanobacterium UBA9251]
MNSNNGLATTAVGGALVVGKLATISGATATGIATTTGGVGITWLQQIEKSDYFWKKPGFLRKS